MTVGLTFREQCPHCAQIFTYPVSWVKNGMVPCGNEFCVDEDKKRRSFKVQTKFETPKKSEPKGEQTQTGNTSSPSNA